MRYVILAAAVVSMFMGGNVLGAVVSLSNARPGKVVQEDKRLFAFSGERLRLVREFFATLDSVDAQLRKGQEPDFWLLVRASVRLWRFRNGWSVAIVRKISRRDLAPPVIAVGWAGSQVWTRPLYLIKEDRGRWLVYEPHRVQNQDARLHTRESAWMEVDVWSGILKADNLAAAILLFPFLAKGDQ